MERDLVGNCLEPNWLLYWRWYVLPLSCHPKKKRLCAYWPAEQAESRLKTLKDNHNKEVSIHIISSHLWIVLFYLCNMRPFTTQVETLRTELQKTIAKSDEQIAKLKADNADKLVKQNQDKKVRVIVDLASLFWWRWWAFFQYYLLISSFAAFITLISAVSHNWHSRLTSSSRS